MFIGIQRNSQCPPKNGKIHNFWQYNMNRHVKKPESIICIKEENQTRSDTDVTIPDKVIKAIIIIIFHTFKVETWKIVNKDPKQQHKL